jgi:DNA-binding transcriptional MerR regulator
VLPADPTVSLTELSQATGESERTLRYWVQFGLLSGPLEKGPAARYPADHVARVAWIRGRQAEGVPLKAILTELAKQDRPQADPPAPVTAAAAQAPGQTAIQEYLARANLLSQKGTRTASVPAPNSLVSMPPSAEWNPPRSRWEHLQLDDGVELLVKRPLDTWRQRKIEKLLRYAATLFANPGSAADSADPDATP